MNPDTTGSEGVRDAEEMGEPIRELRDLEVDVSSGFLFRVLSNLRRRSLVSQLSTMIWIGGGQAFLELLRTVFSLINPGKSPEGGSD
jgi:hypothetical protein